MMRVSDFTSFQGTAVEKLEGAALVMPFKPKTVTLGFVVVFITCAGTLGVALFSNIGWTSLLFVAAAYVVLIRMFVRFLREPLKSFRMDAHFVFGADKLIVVWIEDSVENYAWLVPEWNVRYWGEHYAGNEYPHDRVVEFCSAHCDPLAAEVTASEIEARLHSWRAAPRYAVAAQLIAAALRRFTRR